MNSNPRATTFISTTKDQNNAIRIIKEFRSMQNPTLHYILCKYIECNIIKGQPEFLEILFNDHPNLVIEMIEWILTPKLIAKRKKIKSNLDFFPYRSKEFMKDNIYFYEQLYLSARSSKLPISIWFNFLKKQNFDKETIYTALGYFAQVMIPFARYQFSGSASLSLSIDISSQGDEVETLSIMKILPKKLIEELIEFCYYEPIFQFLKTAVLVSIEDPTDYEISRGTMLKILQVAQTQGIFTRFPALTPQANQQLGYEMDLLENVSLSLKQVIANIDSGNDMQLRTQSFISVILESKTIPYAINQIIQSKLCNPSKTKVSPVNSMELSSSQEITASRMTTASQNPLSLSQGCLPSPKVCINLFQSVEQDLMQTMLKILTYSVQIFIRIPKQITMPPEESENKQERYQHYKLIVNSFREQMQYLLDNLQQITRLVYSEQAIISSPKSIPFSSGQKIKPITFMKFQYLKLIHNVLIMIQCRGSMEGKMEKLKLSADGKHNINVRKTKSIDVPPFDLKIERLYIIEVIQKYLSENRWNNIVHHVLQKICHSLIICSYDYLSRNIEKDKNKKLTESFLAFLIENFTQRDYIFLNTFKFTTQGNLQSLYNISKDLAYTLNSTNQLVILLNEFEPWKKFIMNDLKVYEEKVYPNSIKPDDDGNQETIYNDVTGLKVDEADSIRKLIQNISSTKKWPNKISKNKGNSKSGIIRNSSEQRLSNGDGQHLSKSTGYFFPAKKQPLKKTLNDLLKKKVQYSRQFQNQHEIRSFEVQDISVREELSKQISKYKKEIADKKENKIPDAYFVFKNYAAMDKRNNKLD